MAIRSRAQREMERRRKAKRNRSQLLGATQGGQRRPMQQGYTTTKVEPPKFRESSAGADIMQAGQAYKGAKGLHDFTMGKEAYTDAAGKVVPARAPFSFGDKSIFGEGGHVDEYFGKVGNRWDEATEGLFGGDPIPDASSFGVKPPPRGLLSPATPNINIGGYDAGTGDAEGMVDLSGKRIRGPNINDFGASHQLTNPNIAAQAAVKAGEMAQLTAPGSFGGGGMGASSNLLSGAGAGSGLQGLGHLGNFSSGVPAGTDVSFGLGPKGFGSTIGPSGTATGSIQAGSSSGSAASGMQGADAAASGASGQPWLAYANIGKDLILGGPGSEKITGSTAGDAAIRAAAAYFTFGLSEIPYAFI